MIFKHTTSLAHHQYPIMCFVNQSLCELRASVLRFSSCPVSGNSLPDLCLHNFLSTTLFSCSHNLHVTKILQPYRLTSFPLPICYSGLRRHVSSAVLHDRVRTFFDNPRKRRLCTGPAQQLAPTWLWRMCDNADLIGSYFLVTTDDCNSLIPAILPTSLLFATELCHPSPQVVDFKDQHFIFFEG